MITEIKFDTIGKCGIGKHINKYVVIKDDTEGKTGGYYIYITQNLNDDSPVFDNWYETIDPVRKFVEIYGVTFSDERRKI